MPHRRSSRPSRAAAALSAALAAGALTAVPAQAQQAPDTVVLQVLGINDFHGHLDPGRGGAPSVAGVLGGAVASFRQQNPNTVFVSAGDNIGASPFISSSQQDAPTLDVLDEIGLAVSAVGNHEFDRGYADLSGRVASRADFPYLGANVEGESPALPEYEVVQTASGVTIGFIGVVTQQTATLVSPAGIRGLTFGDPVAAANRVADDLSDGVAGNGEADVVVLLAHEGAVTAASAAATCEQVATRDDAFGRIVRNTDSDVDAILGGHTHLVVDCEIAGPGGQVRPVLEASEYGKALARLRLTWDRGTERVTAASGDVVSLTPPSGSPAGTPPPFPADPRVEALVAQAAASADEVGRRVIGRITADIPRAQTADGSEDRGSESLLGNFIADVQLSATDGEDEGGAQIAFMNPGGLRADLLRDQVDAGEAVGEVTYGEAAVVQPFANTLFTLTLTGAQVKQVLEEQYQPAGSSRPFLALGVSKGFRYELDDAAPRGSRIRNLTLDGAPLDPAGTYRIVTNSFLASGGDNFATLATGTDRRDTGLDDLSVLVRHFAANSPITPDTTDRAVRVGAAPGTAPPPLPDVTGTKRLDGLDRYATAAAIARDSFPAGPVPVVIVVTGQEPADSVAAGPAADLLGGPVLPVARDSVPGDVRRELDRLDPARILVVGGPAAVSDAVLGELRAFTTGTVTRLAGADRFETAARVATVFPSPVARVFLASGGSVPDAVSAAAAGALTSSPVLLLGGRGVPAATAAALRQLQPRTVSVVGGPAVVPDSVLTGLRAAGLTVERLAGPDRYATAAQVAAAFWPGTTGVVYLANGRNPVDALTGVPAAGRDAAPLLLVESTCTPSATRAALDRLQPATLVVLGGEAAVSARAAAGTPVCGAPRP